MTEPIRILHLEDNPRDAELVTGVLESAGIPADIVHVRDADQFNDRLEETAFDAILCDYNVPGCDGLSALAHARTKQPGAPVLMVSGSIGEEEAVRCLHGGAADYLLKDRLERLPIAVTRAIEHARAIARQNREAETRRELEMRFTRFAEQSDDIFWFLSVDPEQRVYVSPAVEKTWGLPPDVHYRNSRIWIETIHPEDRARVTEAFEAFLRDEAPYWVEYRVQRPDGVERHVIDRGTLIRDDGGAITGASGVAQDVTERRHLEEQFRQAQKLEAVGRLAGGIAHDFNNVLTVISGFTEFVDQQLGPDHPCHDDLRQVRNAAEYAARLTRQLLAFSRKQIIRPVVMDLNATLQHNAAMLRRLVGEDIEVIVKTSASTLLIKADPGQIDQVLMNLTVNARDAMPDGGILTIETASERLDAVHHAVDTLIAPGEYARLIVSDTGHGMTPEVLKNLFEPFFTTKGADKGTGLGLSTVYGIVRQSGGAIRVSSRPGAGAAFTIYLPLASEAKATPSVPASDRRPRHAASETILLVEDQDALLKVAARTLERAGYRVLQATTPSAAFALLAEHGAAVSLVVTDVIMPEMNGPALVEKLLALAPDLQVLYMSGYTHDALSRISALDEDVVLLDKPFTPSKLLDTVGHILDSRLSSDDGAARR